jgi:hypothetical protein
MVRIGVIVTPPPFSLRTRTCFTPRIFAGFCFLRNRVNAAPTRFTVPVFFRFRLVAIYLSIPSASTL